MGVVKRVKVCSAWPMRTVLRESVPRSARRSVRECAGYPFVVVWLPALARADVERGAGVTGSVVAIGVSSVNSNSGRRAWSSKET